VASSRAAECSATDHGLPPEHRMPARSDGGSADEHPVHWRDREHLLRGAVPPKRQAGCEKGPAIPSDHAGQPLLGRG